MVRGRSVVAVAGRNGGQRDGGGERCGTGDGYSDTRDVTGRRTPLRGHTTKGVPESGSPACLTGPPHSDLPSCLARKNPVWCYKTQIFTQPHHTRRALPHAHQHNHDTPYTRPDAPRGYRRCSSVASATREASVRVLFDPSEAPDVRRVVGAAVVLRVLGGGDVVVGEGGVVGAAEAGDGARVA